MSKRAFFTDLQKGFTQWLQRLGYAGSTVLGNQQRLHRFFTYLEAKGVSALEEITPELIKGYEAYLDKLPMNSSTISMYLSSLRNFDEYLINYGYAPIITVKLKMITSTISSRIILTQQEIKGLYQATDQSILGYRDRAMLGIYYGCGLRAQEGLLLQVKDIDFKNGLLQVSKTKTYTPRYVPMSDQVQDDLKEWLEYGRKLVLKVKNDHVLIHSNGKYKEAKGFNSRLKQLQESIGLEKSVTLHGLRHSIATHLLENGMELEQIRQFLGHGSLEVTQRYTHLFYEQL